MSTKIYNGYRLPLTNHASLPKVMQYLDRKRKAIVDCARRESSKSLVKLAIGNFDSTWLGRNKGHESSKGSALINAMMFVAKEAKKVKAEGIRSPYDWSCSVIVLKGRQRLLAMLYCEDERLTKIAKSILEPFPYWNNTDRPSNMSEKEWDERGQEWDEVLGYDAPSKKGMLFTYIEDGWFPLGDYSDVRRVLRSNPEWAELDHRARYQARDIEFAKLIKAGHTIHDSLKDSSKEKARVLALAKKIKAKLKPTITLEDLTTNMAKVVK